MPTFKMPMAKKHLIALLGTINNLLQFENNIPSKIVIIKTFNKCGGS